VFPVRFRYLDGKRYEAAFDPSDALRPRLRFEARWPGAPRDADVDRGVGSVRVKLMPLAAGGDR